MIRDKLHNLLIAGLGIIASTVTLQTASAQISTPTDISNLVFWVDGKDINGTGVQPADGSVITTWIDKSPSGNNLTTQAGTVTFEELGFDGINPGLRFPVTARMAASNPFSSNFQDEMTVFFVNANVTLTANFSLSLNGTNQGTNSADGRFSFHTPWVDNRVYFDASACCGTTRLRGSSPNTLTETTLYTGLNDLPGNRQWLRIDGQAFEDDTTGHNANVSRGIHIGDVPSSSTYDGRFAEVLVYDRALTLTEVQEVECFLLLKWKLGDAPTGCTVEISANKTVQPYITTGSEGYALPGTDVIYTISATHINGPSLDSETVFLADRIPSETIFYNGDIDDGGPEVNPVSFSSTASGLSLDYATDIAYSNLSIKPNNLTDCSYTPSAGYDSNVTYVCIQPTGIFNSGTPAPSFEVSFRTRIK